MSAFDLLMALAIVPVVFGGVWLIQQPFLKVGYVPSPRKTIDAMLDVAHLSEGQTVLDLGAGDGRVLLAAAARQPGIRALGYEAGLLPWVLARMRCRGTKVQVRLQSLFTAPLEDADVIFTYLFPTMMQDVFTELQSRCKPGTTVVCHSFGLPGLSPVEERVVRIGWHTHTIRAYRLN